MQRETMWLGGGGEALTGVSSCSLALPQDETELRLLLSLNS